MGENKAMVPEYPFAGHGSLVERLRRGCRPRVDWAEQTMWEAANRIEEIEAKTERAAPTDGRGA